MIQAPGQFSCCKNGTPHFGRLEVRVLLLYKCLIAQVLSHTNSTALHKFNFVDKWKEESLKTLAVCSFGFSGRNIWPFGYFLLEHFYTNEQLKIWFMVHILTFSSSWMEMYWIFKFLYFLAKVWATLSEIGQFSFQYSGHSVPNPPG
jgi:hypothetical protein